MTAFIEHWSADRVEKLLANGPVRRLVGGHIRYRRLREGDVIWLVADAHGMPALVGAFSVLSAPVEVTKPRERPAYLPPNSGQLKYAAVKVGRQRVGKRCVLSIAELKRLRFASENDRLEGTRADELLAGLASFRKLTAASDARLRNLWQGAPSIMSVAESRSKAGSAPRKRSRRATLRGATDAVFPDEVPPEQKYAEGATKQVLVNAYERDPRARRACLNHHGTECSVCGMSFSARYGALGKDFIHVHHLTPLSLLNGTRRVDPATEMLPVCPNCHAMLHRRNPPYTPRALRLRLKKATG
ncbi:MAG: HNH endonuclease [Gemmatimonadetes bacterium]|nr:HNH endonuclease [Gemmatimonadota bacterium]